MGLAVFYMCDRVFDRVRAGGMRHAVAIETGAGVAEIVDDGALRTEAATSTVRSESKPAPCSIALSRTSLKAVMSCP